MSVNAQPYVMTRDKESDICTLQEVGAKHEAQAVHSPCTVHMSLSLLVIDSGVQRASCVK